MDVLCILQAAGRLRTMVEALALQRMRDQRAERRGIRAALNSSGAGWGGDAYALYGRGGDRLLVARWRWDTPHDAKQFLVALRAWADDGLAGARRVDTAAWRTDTGAAALAAAGDSVALVLAPDVPVAARTSLAAVRGR